MDIRCCQVASAANDRVSTRASPNLIELEQHDAFQHIFSLMGPETLEGAKGVLDFAQASKACMRIARGTYLRPINTDSSPGSPTMWDFCSHGEALGIERSAING
jgi:hypothetical protein